MNEFTRYNEDGSVDVYLSKEAYEKALVKWVEEKEVLEVEMREGVNSVLRASGENRVALSKLVNMVLCKLQPSLDEFDSMQSAVESFVKRNTVSEKNPNGFYESQKGKGGGYRFKTEKPSKTSDTIPAPSNDDDVDHCDDDA